MSWLADSTPPGLRGRAMSLRLTGNRLGQVVVPTAAGVLAAGAGVAGVLWITAAALGSGRKRLAPRDFASIQQTPCRHQSATERNRTCHEITFTEAVRRELVPTGHFRTAINLGNPVLAQGTPDQPRGVTVAIARALADALNSASN